MIHLIVYIYVKVFVDLRALTNIRSTYNISTTATQRVFSFRSFVFKQVINKVNVPR